VLGLVTNTSINRCVRVLGTERVMGKMRVSGRMGTNCNTYPSKKMSAAIDSFMRIFLPILSVSSFEVQW
jgi:hypothetical protein